ncbi:two-component regulator propeller domain-containing protein [Flammeovirgaceae bacterium SG7u.111]|nr:two-component regulator propeller domain-containing protein [Flammeovirgaceae bacterium SG7u.132]WPO34927.1 two-component regulator propeller domain-containing protein [Flammeovirgaceae bacterium SG7u.111]
MIQHYIKLSFIAIILSFGIWDTVAYCQDLKFRHLSIEEGLSNNTVWSIIQDDEGYMWFGTNDGLNRYDGYDLTVFRNDGADSLSLSSSRITELYRSNNGQLWVGTSKGLNLYVNENKGFHRFQPPNTNTQELFVHSIIQDGHDNLWLGTSSGVYCFNPSSQEFIKLDERGDSFSLVSDVSVYKIVEGHDGILWFCTNKGVYRLENGLEIEQFSPRNLPVFESGEPFRDLLIDKQGNHWFATESEDVGVFVLGSGKDSVEVFTSDSDDQNTLPGNRVRVLKQLSNGSVWIGAFSGLSIYDPLNEEFFIYTHNKYDDKSLSQNSVRDIYEDREGGIWIATYNGGVNYTHSALSRFKHYKEEIISNEGLSDNLVSSFCEDTSGNIWIGTENGLNFFNVSTGVFEHYYEEHAGLIENTIKSILLDESGNLWAGGFVGLSIWNTKSGNSFSFRDKPDSKSSIGNHHIQVIYQDAKKQIWIGTQGGGLKKYDKINKSFITYFELENETDKYVDSHVWAISEDRKGNLWVGTERGLEYFDTEKGLFTREKLKTDAVFEKTRNLEVLSMLLSKEDVLMIGTLGRGLLAYDTQSGEIINISIGDGLADNTINGILEDDNGKLWVSTNKGISTLDLIRDPEKESLVVNKIMNFNKSDGVQGYQHYPNSAYKAKSGQLFFGGSYGFTTFFPEDVTTTVNHPDVVFKTLLVSDSSVRSSFDSLVLKRNTKISLAYSYSDFSIEFAGLNFFEPNEINYAYKLDPIDKEWNVIGNQRRISFSKLQPGDYTLKVKATNDVGDWGTNENILHIIVSPPLWRTVWAYIMYAVVLLGLLYLFFVFASKWGRLKSNLEWEHMQREKENELHQQRIIFFTDISHELRTPLTLILAPLENLITNTSGSPRLKNQLGIIQRNGERMLQLINQLLDLRKLEKGHLALEAAEGNISSFVKEISLAFREPASQKKIDFEVIFNNEQTQLWFDRDKMEIVMYNLLSNALKFTPEGGKIELCVAEFAKEALQEEEQKRYKNGYVEIVVADSGVGIPADQLENIFDRFYQTEKDTKRRRLGLGVGLEITKKFVELHSGVIQVDSVEAQEGKPGNTKFTIRIPRGKEHLTDTQIIHDFQSSEDISLYTKSFDVDDKSQPSHREPAQSGQNTEVEGGNEKYTVLIVEDNEQVRSLLVELFSSEYEVVEAPNGKVGFEKALEGTPELIISDVMMPEMDGMELCRKIKTDQRTSHIPVILLTARTAVTFQIKGFETGADDYVTKPFSSNLLKARTRNLIDQRIALREQTGNTFKLVPEDVSVTSVDEAFLNKTIDYINKNISESDLSVESIANEVGMSRVHLYRKIKALTNLTPVGFIKKIRLEYAAQLLKTGKLSISEVRYSVGYQHADYFREQFKEYFGQTPTKYMASFSESPDSSSSNK